MASVVDEIQAKKTALPPALPALGRAALWLLALPFLLVGWLLGSLWSLALFCWASVVIGFEKGRW